MSCYGIHGKNRKVAQFTRGYYTVVTVCVVYRGTDEHLGCSGRVDIINSTLGKALGGAAGIVTNILIIIIIINYRGLYRWSPRGY